MIGPKLRRFMAMCPALFRGQPAPGEIPSVASHLVAIATELEQERLDALKADGAEAASTRKAMRLHAECFFVGDEERLPEGHAFEWAYEWQEWRTSSEPERPVREDVVEHGVAVSVRVDGSRQFAWHGTCETWWRDRAEVAAGEVRPEGYSGGQPTRGGYSPMSFERERGEAAGRSALLLALRAFDYGPAGGGSIESSGPPMPGEFEALERDVAAIHGLLVHHLGEDLLAALRKALT